MSWGWCKHHKWTLFGRNEKCINLKCRHLVLYEKRKITPSPVSKYSPPPKVKKVHKKKTVEEKKEEYTRKYCKYWKVK